MDNIFFDTWESTIRAFIMTILAYFVMIIMLRLSGKRTLSKMNAFDFVVTIALGSTLATVILNKNVALLEGAIAFFLLIFLQFILTWFSVRFKVVKKIITSEPTMLLYKGEVLTNVLKKERITMEELQMAARKKGITKLSQIDVIVLETTGDITVMSDVGNAEAETLADVQKFDR